MNFDDSFARLIGIEGGYTLNLKDPGGETKFGISKRSYPERDIKNLTLGDAKEIYQRDYWAPAGCMAVPDKIKYDLFDTAVNSGISRAVKLLQLAVGTAPDGVLGVVTLRAVLTTDPVRVGAHFNAHRLAFMTALPNWPTFSRGWALRISDNLLEI